MPPQKYTKREFFAISGGALATVAGVHIAGRLEGDPVDELEHAEAISQLKDPRDRIEYAKELFDTNPSFGIEKGTWRELANKPVNAAPDKSRHEYATHFFKTTRGVDLTGSETIPTAIRENLSRLVPGLIAQESKYDNHAVSSAKAKTLWQIIPAFYNGKVKSGENLKDMTVSTRIAFQKFEDIYKKFQDGVKWRSIDEPGLDFSAFQQRFNLTDQQWENFLTMAMVNAYNAGERRMLEILNWFIGEFTREDFYDAPDSTELDLFAMMTDLARKSGKFDRYGPHANNYVYYCMGGAESLSGELPLEFSKLYLWDITVDRTKDLTERRVKDTVLPVAGGVATGTAIHYGLGLKKEPSEEPVTMEAANDEDKPGRLKGFTTALSGRVMGVIKSLKPQPKKKVEAEIKTDKSEERLENSGRRKFLGWSIAGGGVAAVGGTGIYFRQEIADAIGGAFERGSLEGTYALEEVDAEVARLRKRGIRLYSSGKKFFEDGRVDEAGRTAFVGMRKDVWATTEQLLEDLDLLDKGEKEIIITGLAEGAGHSSRTHGHSNGYSVDFRTSSANKISNALIEDTKVLNPTTRQLSSDHKLIESGLVVGDKIFRYRSKYFLFGVKHEGRVFVCYFDAESTHRHMEMIPWDDYNVDSRADFQRLARLNNSMASIWRAEVRDHIRENF